MVHLSTQSLKKAEAIYEYCVKPGKQILVHGEPKRASNFFCKITQEMAEQYQSKTNPVPLSNSVMADLGDASLWIEAYGKSLAGGAKEQVVGAFGNLTSVCGVQARSKGALSILTKLERKLVKELSFNTMEDAVAKIGDLEGSRVLIKSLDKLSARDINQMISKLEVEGKKLTPKQKELLRKYIFEEKIRTRDIPEAYRLFYSFVEPLVQKRSKEVVDTLTLGILKHRMVNEKGFDVAQLKFSGHIDPKLIERLLTDKTIQPLQITEINNYRGNLGIPEFTNEQIRQLHIAMNFGRTKNEYLPVISEPRGLKGLDYTPEELIAIEKKSIKASGYRTAQMNVTHSNGSLGEMQFRGVETNEWGECEHIAYDLRQGKNTLGDLYDDYAKAIQKLSDAEYEKYNEYLQKWYNYENRLELGLPAKKPTLPTRFDRVLSAENMRRLHEEDSKIQAYAKRGFTPHYLQQVA